MSATFRRNPRRVSGRAGRLPLLARKLLAAACALALSGCVLSEQPLFDPSTALTPAPAGRYEQQEMRDGRWTKLRAGMLRRVGRAYEWKPDDNAAAVRFMVFEAGSNAFTLYAGITDAGKTKHYYALIKPSADGYLFYQPLCSDFTKLRLRAGLLPVKIVDGECYFADNAALSAALVAHAEAIPAEFRYVPIR